jgi:ABC-type nitrate/sulfonate/bicarbonate transport system ATPase subunit
MKLQASRICQSYRGMPVIQDIDLEVDEGEVVALLGPSGVGKTTLFNILSGIDKPDSGQVLIDGEDITGRAGRISYMLQKDLLFEYKTVIDNIALPLIIKGQKKEAAREKALGYFERFGLQGTEKLFPDQLSGGMRQRAALLRTYLFSQDVTLLDEPFSSLDAITKRQLHKWYLEIIHSLRMATLLITHDIDEAIRLSDRIYLMTGKPGRITDMLTILRNGKTDEAFETSPEFMTYKGRILKALQC